MEASDQSPVIQDTTLPSADRGSTVGDASSSPVYEQSKPEAVGKNRDAASMDPTLTAKLRADYDALQNDVQQARELASDFQRQLAGKSNECAELKRVFGKTKNHLIRLEKSITELRAERHRLASEAMRAIAWEQRVRERDAQIEQLETEVKALREQLAREKNRACKTKTDVERSSAWRALFGKKVS